MKGAVLTPEGAAAVVKRMRGSVHDLSRHAQGQPFFELRLASASNEIGYEGHCIGFHGRTQEVCIGRQSGYVWNHGPLDRAIARREDQCVRSLVRYLSGLTGDRVAAARALTGAA